MRFLMMSIFNMYICNMAKKRLGKDGKQITLKNYLKFFVFMIVLLGINQGVFMYMQENNLYEEIEVARSMPVAEFKKHQQELEIKIMQRSEIPMAKRVEFLHQVESIIKTLSHPATRLTYDTFGIQDTEYAWAFKDQNFLLSVIIQSSIFYVICIFMNMMSKSRD